MIIEDTGRTHREKWSESRDQVMEKVREKSVMQEKKGSKINVDVSLPSLPLKLKWTSCSRLPDQETSRQKDRERERETHPPVIIIMITGFSVETKFPRLDSFAFQHKSYYKETSSLWLINESS